jgi:hypothetical protein
VVLEILNLIKEVIGFIPDEIREILRLSYELKLSLIKIDESLEMSITSVGEYLTEFKRMNQD